MSDYVIKDVSFLPEGSEKPILTNISAVLPKGKTTLLLGESGTGKSTLIEVLMHIVPEYRHGRAKGSFYCGEQDFTVLSLKEVAGKIGLVFQNPESQFCTYTVTDELAFGLENMSFPQKEIKAKIDEALKLVGIEALRDQPLHVLSGGEKQKVAIASILATGAELLIFDEPTSNLDPQGVDEVFKIIDAVKKQYNRTILIVEHQLDKLLNQVDHLLVLGRSGEIVYSGDVAEGLRYLVYESDLNVHLPKALEFMRSLEQKPSNLFATPEDVARYILQNPDIRKRPKGFPSKRNAEPVLECEGLTLSLGGTAVLKGVDLVINQGDFMAVLGPNGAGKTTLLHSMLGIYKAAKGSIRLFGKPLKWYGKTKWSYAGIAFQNPEWQFVASTVEDEILYSLKKTRLTDQEKQTIVDGMLQQFGLTEKRNKNPFLLSQGEKRRLSVATILVRKQKLLMLDEPTFGQDKRNQDELMELMQKLNQEGITIVMISHDMDLVYRYCNRVVLLVDGEIRYDGAPLELFSQDELRRAGRLQEPFWYLVDQICEEQGLGEDYEEIRECVV